MFKILATVCFLSVGIGKQNLCMQGWIPMTQPIATIQACNQSINEISEYIDEDFKQRRVSIYLQCVRENGTTNI
tara:strand:- start:1949 stop:2170 length:222 start_codon:yes stop_codon:yes gene_type:complete